MANYPDHRAVTSSVGYQRAVAFEREHLVDGRVHDVDGRLSPIVHQYDRLVESHALRAWRKRYGPDAPWPERAQEYWSSVEALKNHTCTGAGGAGQPSLQCGIRLRLHALEAAVRGAENDHIDADAGWHGVQRIRVASGM